VEATPTSMAAFTRNCNGLSESLLAASRLCPPNQPNLTSRGS
jgi:hypothetical protein